MLFRSPAKRLIKKQPLSKLSVFLFVEPFDLLGDLNQVHTPGSLDLVADQEVVNQEADPAEGHDGDGEEYLEKGFELVVLEDVKHAPDRSDDAGDADDRRGEEPGMTGKRILYSRTEKRRRKCCAKNAM